MKAGGSTQNPESRQKQKRKKKKEKRKRKKKKKKRVRKSYLTHVELAGCVVAGNTKSPVG